MKILGALFNKKSLQDKPNLKDKKVLCWDYGLFPELCSRLARDVAKVWYFVPWGDAFPRANKALIGEGIEGLERVLNFFDYIDKADFLYFPDTHCGDLVEFLKAKGYSVTGVGKAEELELDRWKGRQTQKEVGLPTQTTRRVKGLDALKSILEKEKNKFVKLSIFRGDIESWKHTDYESSKPLLDHLAYDLGPKQNHIEFTVEDEIKGVEPGLDGIVFDGDNLSPCIVGYELKGMGYIGSVMPYESVCPQLKTVNDKLAPVFKKLKTRFFFSTEVMIPDKNKGYLIDYTCRSAAPCVSAIQTELLENFSEVIYGLATGQKIQPIMKYKYAAGVSVESGWADKHWLQISFPKELRRWIKLRMACKFDNNYYAVPGFPSLASVIALGNSVDEAINLCKERSKEIKAYQIDVNLSGFDLMKKEIEDGRSKGVNF